MPLFKYKGLLVSFAAFSGHCSLFPMSLSVLAAFKKELKDFSQTKGSIPFPWTSRCRLLWSRNW